MGHTVDEFPVWVISGLLGSGAISSIGESRDIWQKDRSTSSYFQAA